jgi:hypothetical protein
MGNNNNYSNLSLDERAVLHSHYLNQLNDLVSKYSQIFEKMEEYKNKLEVLSPQYTEMSDLFIGLEYSKDFTWRKKAEHILNATNHPLSISDIARKVLKIEPDLDFKKTVNGISVALSTNKDKYLITADESGTTLYGLKEKSQLSLAEAALIEG